MQEHPSVVALRERFGAVVLRHEVVAGDEHVVYVEGSRIADVLRWLRDEPSHRFNFLSDITAVDYGGGRPIQVVYQLYSIPHRRALRLKVELPLTSLVVDSATPLWRTADWLEREVYDMFGVQFRGHPDLRRILMPQNYAEGHPLRKDFPLRGRFSRAEQTRRALSHDPEDHYIPLELDVGRRSQVVPWRETGGKAIPKAPPEEPAAEADEP
jgi:NADH-quinone oxidoreductase subunit C